MSQQSEQEQVTIPIVKESLSVETHRETAEKVRVRTVVHEDQVEIHEPLIAEHLDVERVPMDRFVDGPIPIRHEGDTTIIPVLREELVVAKRLKLVEELRVTKRQETEWADDQVRLRRQEAIIEHLDPAADSGGQTARSPSPNTAGGNPEA